jgi:hypothetical protein
MKHFLLIIITAALSACGKQSPAGDQTPQAKTSGEETDGAGDAVHLKAGRGLGFHPKLKKAIGIEIAEVTEEKIAPEFTVNLHGIQGADSKFRTVSLTSAGGVEASGWLSAEEASRIRPGQEVTLQPEPLTGSKVGTGVVKRLDKSPYTALGEFEIVVETTMPFDTGTRLIATFHSPAGEAVPVVPRSALLKTAEGWFVYTVNDDFFLRTPVKVGAMNDKLVEIADGLYSGDQIVSSPVNSLWMSELQLLRGGKSCTCGH